jgi:hypothetical protein
MSAVCRVASEIRWMKLLLPMAAPETKSLPIALDALSSAKNHQLNSSMGCPVVVYRLDPSGLHHLL